MAPLEQGRRQHLGKPVSVLVRLDELHHIQHGVVDFFNKNALSLRGCISTLESSSRHAPRVIERLGLSDGEINIANITTPAERKALPGMCASPQQLHQDICTSHQTGLLFLNQQQFDAGANVITAGIL